jgi:RHS repeat-associated protein
MATITTRFHTLNGQIRGQSSSSVFPDQIYLPDSLGNVTAAVTNSAAATQTVRQRFRAYGQTAYLATGPYSGIAFNYVGSVGYRRTGRAHSSHYVRARHYSQQDARWTTSDPHWPQEQSYGYAGAGPTLQIDPSGAATQSCCSCPASLNLSISDFIPQTPTGYDCGGSNWILGQLGFYGWKVTVTYSVTSWDNHTKPGGGTVFHWHEVLSLSSGFTQVNDNITDPNSWGQTLEGCMGDLCKLTNTQCKSGGPCEIVDWPGTYCGILTISPPSLTRWYLLSQQFSLYSDGKGNCKCTKAFFWSDMLFEQWNNYCFLFGNYVPPDPRTTSY